MESLEQLDPYCIEDIQFYMGKKTRSTTLQSIVISITIFTLAIILSYDSLSDIWADRQDLDINEYTQKFQGDTFTSNILCVISSHLDTSVPSSTLVNFNQKTGEIYKTFELTQKFNEEPAVLGMSNNHNFQCYDIEDAIVSQYDCLSLQLSSNKVTVIV